MHIHVYFSITQVISPKGGNTNNKKNDTQQNHNAKPDPGAGGDSAAVSAKGGPPSNMASPSGPLAAATVFAFDFPTHMCGLLIGAKGRQIKMLMQKSGASIALKHKMFDQDNQVVTIKGNNN